VLLYNGPTPLAMQARRGGLRLASYHLSPCASTLSKCWVMLCVRERGGRRKGREEESSGEVRVVGAEVTCTRVPYHATHGYITLRRADISLPYGLPGTRW